MNPRQVNVYAACDKAIKAMDRLNVELFGRLRMAKWDELNIIKAVREVYDKSYVQARKRYYEVAFESYLLYLAFCRIEPKKAHRMAEKAITEKWVDDVLKETDLITLYRFYSEMQRKIYRLAEALEASQDRDAEIKKALRYWSQQVGQYFINVTDYAGVQAFEDAGIEKVMWVTEKDERVCSECRPRDGRIYNLDEVPVKPHWGCRCRLLPVIE